VYVLKLNRSRSLILNKNIKILIINIITILNLIIKLLNVVNIMGDNIHDVFFLNENENEENSKLIEKKTYHEYYIGKLACKAIIAIGLIT
jgi:hypothetical protein